jgi:HlyD family secretion protein
MSKLKPIPTPWKIRCLQWRLQLLPVFVCGGASLGVLSLWNDVAEPIGIPGEVEIVTGTISSPDAGYLTEVQAERFSRVEAGETMGFLITTPPDLAASSLAVLKAEIELTRLGWIDPVLDQQRNLLQLEGLKLDSLAARADLAIASIQLLQARRELARKEQLFTGGMLAQENLEDARLRVDVLEAEVAGKEQLASQLERALTSLGGREGESPNLPDALRATLALQGERLKLLEAQLRPVPLRAPITGLVEEVYRRNGEYLTAGEAVLSISAPRTETIVAYLRQPLAVQPAVGTPVEIRTRRRDKLTAAGEIVAIGPHMQEITPALRRPVAFRHDSGLPVKISLPPELGLLPGETVDIFLR